MRRLLRLVAPGLMLVCAACGGEGGAAGAAFGAKPLVIQGSDYGGEDRMIRAIYYGNFAQIREDIRSDRGRMKAVFAVGQYHRNYASYCKDSFSEPTSDYVLSETEVNDWGLQVGPSEEKSRFRIRNRFLDDYKNAESISGLQLLGAWGTDVGKQASRISRALSTFLQEAGCKSPETKQFEENLTRMMNEKPSLQEEQGDEFNRFLPMCYVYSDMEDGLRKGNGCRCTYNVLKDNLDERSLNDMLLAGDEINLVAAIMSKAGMAEKVQSCLK